MAPLPQRQALPPRTALQRRVHRSAEADLVGGRELLQALQDQAPLAAAGTGVEGGVV